MVVKRHPLWAKMYSKRTVGTSKAIQANDSIECVTYKVFSLSFEPMSLLFTQSICQKKPHFPGYNIFRLFPVTERERKIGRRVFTSSLKHRFKKF